MKRFNLLTKYSVLFFAAFFLTVIILSKMIEASNEAVIITSTALLLFYIVTFLFIYKEINKVHYYYNFSIGLVLYLLCSITIFLSGNLELVLIEDPYIDIWIF